MWLNFSISGEFVTEQVKEHPLRRMLSIISHSVLILDFFCLLRIDVLQQPKPTISRNLTIDSHNLVSAKKVLVKAIGANSAKPTSKPS